MLVTYVSRDGNRSTTEVIDGSRLRGYMLDGELTFIGTYDSVFIPPGGRVEVSAGRTEYPEVQ
jgi:hypothetical protein